MSGAYCARFDRKGKYQRAYLASIIPPPNKFLEGIRAPVVDIMDQREPYNWEIKSFPFSKNSHFIFFHKGHEERIPCIPGTHRTDYIDMVSRRFVNPVLQQTVNLKTALMGKRRIRERMKDVVEELFGKDEYDVSKIFKLMEVHRKNLEECELFKTFRKFDIPMNDIPYLGYYECKSSITCPKDLDKCIKAPNIEVEEFEGCY
jgi:hypothetical protein